jgi:hypothetical protein
MLRLKGERDAADTGDRDEITPEDAFLRDDTDSEDETTEPGGDREYREVYPERPRWTPLRGPAVAAGTFVPTFLLIFFGLPYLLGSAAPARTPTASGPRPLASLGADPALSPRTPASEVLRGDVRSGTAGRDWLFGSPPAADEPKIESPKTDSKLEEPSPPVVAEPAPSLPPSRPSRVESSPAPEARAPEPPRHAATPVPPAGPVPEPRAASEPRPVPEPRRTTKEAREWTPAAAFTDRAAAGRLASSIEKQGYPVEIRQDASSSRPWVVWIGAQPSDGSRRR